MKRKYLSLGLALVMALTLCACGGGAVNGTSTGKEDGKLASGTWQQQETGDTDLLSYSAQDLTGPIPEDWTLPSDFKTGDKVRVEVSGDKILYGDIVDGGYLNGFTVAQYADGNLTTVYEFKKGVVRSWQQFFSPDGSKLAVAWAPSTDSTEWSITLVDLTTSGESTLKLHDLYLHPDRRRDRREQGGHRGPHLPAAQVAGRQEPGRHRQPG